MPRLTALIGKVQIAAAYVAALLLASVFAVFILQILFRYIFLMPVGWTVEWVTIAWVWVILFGAAFASTNGEMIRLDFVYLAVSPGLRRVFDVITGLTCASILAWTLPASLDYVLFMDIERTAYLRWPFSWVFAVYVPFALAMILRCLWSVARALIPSLSLEKRHD